MLEETSAYLPFGKERVAQKYGAFTESRKYIGEEFDAGTGLSYLNARYYDGGRGRFVSQDASFLDIGAAGFEEKYERKLRQHLMNPQALNSYSYGLNNPITNADPEGEIVPLIIGAWALAEVGLSAYDIYSTGSTLFDDNASLGEKVTSSGITIAGFALPGGGYGAAGKQIFRQTNLAGQALMKGVANQKVMNLIRDNYRTIKGDLIGSGSAVDAMLHTLKTGNFVGGSNHIDKIKQNVKRINNILHDRNIKLNSAETKAINKILQDSKKALNKLKK